MTDARSRWPDWKLSLVLYPFVLGAVAINLFLLGLIAHFAGWPALSVTPLAAVIWSVPLGVPAAWAAGRWVGRLLDQAEE